MNLLRSCLLNSWRARCFALSAFSAAFASASFAQNFNPGEIVSVRRMGETVDVKVIGQDASGVHVLLKDWQDGTFKPGGSSCYYPASELFRKGAEPQSASSVNSVNSANLANAGAAVQPASAGHEAGNANELAGSGPLSKAQIIDFLKARVGTDGPHPKKESISSFLVEEIKKRGVSFKYNSLRDLSDLSKAGADQRVNYALQDNFGVPVKEPWLYGAWELQFTNATGFFASRDSVAKLGFLAIEPGHTYIWKIHEDDSPNKWIEGKWRQASSSEMKYQGGAGIVLLNGEQNDDYIVHKDQTAQAGQDWINVADLSTRQVRRGGLRKTH